MSKIQKETQNSIERTDSQKKSKKIIVSIAIIIIIIIVLLLLKCCCGQEDIGTSTEEPTIGNFEITDTTENEETDSTNEAESQMLTFVGRGEYFVSKQSPKIELRNSEKNQALEALLTFTVLDAATNEVIAKTGTVKPGQYVYVNMMDHFNVQGDYDIVIRIRVTDKNGNELNGMDQKAVIHVIEKKTSEEEN